MKEEHATTSIAIESAQFGKLIDTIQSLVKVYAAAQIRHDQGTERNSRFLKVFGLTDQEIGDLLGVDRSAVTKALSKGKGKLE